MKAVFQKRNLLFRNNCHATLLENVEEVGSNTTQWSVYPDGIHIVVQMETNLMNQEHCV